jgi:type I restriction enzyme S subunit
LSDVTTLAEACQISTGKLDANAAVDGGQYPFFTCAEMPSAIDHYAYDGSVILVAGNNAQGKFHVSRYTGKFNAYQRTYILKAFDSFQRDYIYYSLKLALEHMRDSSQGSQTKFLTMPILRGLGISRKSLAEQQSVTSVLSAIDAKIDLNNRINAELEALAKTIYDYWFVQFDFPDANGRPYKSSGGAMVWNDTLKREIPAGWKAGSLDDLGQIVGGSTPSTSNPDHFGENMIPWITPKDLSNNKGNKFIARGETDVSDAGKRSASLTLHPAGTVLMSSRAPVGYLAIALNPVTTNQGFKSFVPSKGYGTSFVYYAVERSLPTIIQYASGSTFVEISGSVLKSVQAILPNKPVSDIFCDQIEPIVKRQQQAELENVELTQLRDWLLPLLMNGQVRVA